ncbi:MAG: hydantoinase B/oxoprolinase family protein [Rhodospirillaceae bacterium]|jgi:N-methylhydantoinase B|nr:hydantoinase B/oxoprolinase family protein [Rhodospirillaceae bacterium]MBT6139624.1 hydantoinase B/oxoprolinase family protein [Rhodospirillaceae bacterium]
MSDIDPITLEVVTEGLISVVREMRATVFRTARSVAIYEARDFSCGLFDAGGQVVAQSEDIGSHVVPLPWSVEQSLAELGDDLSPGDVILMNDPYRGGTHLNDVTIIYPIFDGDRLVFFPAVREHWADVGGAVPGSMSGTASEIYQEGIRIPPVKIIEKGVLNAPLMEVLLSNMRVREERLGDFNSSLAACRTAERRLAELTDRYGLDTLLACVELNLTRSERRMREKIELLPDGEYYYEDYLETFGPKGFEPLLLPLALTIRGDELTADFTGVSPQVPVPVNSTLAVTAASVFITLKSALDPEQALNHGSFRPVEVIAPEGTIVNVTHPAPAGSHGEIRKRVIACMLGALARACPDLVSGDIHRTSFHNLIGGVDPATGKEFVHYEWSSGGNGGFLEADGPSAMAAIDWGDLSTAQPTEVLESRFPLHIEWSRQGTDSGGPGRNRGGLGMRRALKLTRGVAKYSLLSDGAMMPPFGILGGESGAPVNSFVIHPDNSEHHFASPGKVGGHTLQAGDTVILQSAGGGGYGDPLEREVERVADDVADGLVSRGTARNVYGVILTTDGFADLEATKVQRDQLRAARITVSAVEDDTDAYTPSGPSKKRVLRLNPEDIKHAGLVDGDRAELLIGDGAPLRGWVRPDATVAAGRVPLDPLGCRALGADASASLILRPLLVPDPGSIG